MPGRRAEPIDVLQAKGKKHLTKAEIEDRRERELKVPFTDIHAPKYLTKKQKAKFKYISDMLLDLGVFTELDVDCLGRYIVAHDLYLQYTAVIAEYLCEGYDVKEIDKVQNMQNKAFTQAHAAARDLGLTVTSRCKIAIPPPRNPDDDEL